MKIVSPAILFNGKIYEGCSHPLIGLAMIRDGVCQAPYPAGDAQGFVTDDGRFVRRTVAMVIAVRAGQVTLGKTCHPTELFSEDLRRPPTPN